MAQNRKNFRQALGFVDHHRPGVRFEKAFDIGSQQGEIGRPLEVQIHPAGEGVTRQRTFPALTGTREQDGGK
jgi:hypothetical protein